MFYLEEYLIIASKDQDIKVIKYKELQVFNKKEIKNKEIEQKK